MSPRRTQAQRNLVPRPVRRGFAAASSTGNRVTLTASPSSTYRNGIPGAGATVRLLTAGGTPLLIAGVAVTVAVSSGAATVVSAPVTATTDASGIAVFSVLTLSGTAGAIGLAFQATGYVRDLTSITLTGGVPVASQTTAVVGPGTVAVLHSMVITTRDASGNLLTVGGSTVTLVVTGANSVSSATAIDHGDGTYTAAYTPSNAGSDQVMLRLNGTQISGSPFTSVVAGSGGSGAFTATSLRVGFLAGDDATLWGKGPQVTGGNWNTTEPIWRFGGGSVDPGDVVGVLATGATKNILLAIRLSGAPSQYSDPNGDFNLTTFKSQVDRFLGITQLTTAFANRQAVALVTDEPAIASYNNTFTPAMMRECCRHIKLRWPNCITVARVEPRYMRGGWSGSGTLPINYFDKLDYGWSTYRGNTHDPSVGKTPAQTFAEGKTIQNDAGYGCCYGVNWINLGDNTCWDANNTGSSNGVLEAQNGNDGHFLTCATKNNATFWILDPGTYLAAVVAAASDPDCPIFSNWQHIVPGFSNNALWKGLEQRSDFVAGYVSSLIVGNNRATFNGWRAPK